jgi:hypothetical protein
MVSGPLGQDGFQLFQRLALGFRQQLRDQQQGGQPEGSVNEKDSRVAEVGQLPGKHELHRENG